MASFRCVYNITGLQFLFNHIVLLGIASIFTIKGIISELKQITELVEIGKVQNKRQIMCEGTEEGICRRTMFNMDVMIN